MHLLIHPTPILAGKITPPSSKSHTIRGLIFALLSKGQSVLHNALDSEDIRDAIHACQQLGAIITRVGDQLHINSTSLPLQTQPDTIYSGNSGITICFILPLLGYRQNSMQPILLDCGAQMRTRPIKPLVDTLRNLGMHMDYAAEESTCPLYISGNLVGGSAEVEGISSQYISALLIALPCAEKESQIYVHDLHERPYMEMTLKWLDAQKIQYTHAKKTDTDIFTIPGKQRYQPFEKTIAGDFSSASCLIVAAALTEGLVEFRGLNMEDPQGDKRLISILKEMGAEIVIESTRILIYGGKTLTGLKIDANDIPDLLPVLAVLGTQAIGKTEIYNVKQARQKETDRIHSMTEGLRRMGAQIEEHPDGMVIYQSTLQGAAVRGFDDHRTIMSLAVAGLLAQGETIIEGAEAIQKTFPTFVEVMRSIGANIDTCI
jgi:3-phosphoshikimate 1-carboxyvinyltransferase